MFEENEDLLKDDHEQPKDGEILVENEGNAEGTNVEEADEEGKDVDGKEDGGEENTSKTCIISATWLHSEFTSMSMCMNWIYRVAKKKESADI